MDEAIRNLFRTGDILAGLGGLSQDDSSDKVPNVLLGSRVHFCVYKYRIS